MDTKKIEFGICCQPADTGIYADAGFDYFECNVTATFHGEKPENEAEDYRSAISGAALPCRCGNCFLPGSLKVAGPDTDYAVLSAYVENAVRRASECGLDTIVFGSGGARQCPEGFPAEKAASQIEQFVRSTIPVLEKYGMTLVVEPLCDCNMLSSVAAGAVLVQKIAHPRVQLLADSYHFLRTDKAFDALTWSMPLLKHIHVATTASRLAPGVEPSDDLRTFLTVLKRGGYEGRISVECVWKNDPKQEAQTAIRYLRDTWNAIE